MEVFKRWENACLEDIVTPIETNFKKYFQNFSYLFYFEVVMDTCCKLVELEFLIQDFINKGIW